MERKTEASIGSGYTGVRATGNAFWLHRKQWRRFDEYERTLNDSLAGKSLIVLCSYPLAVCGATEVLDVARNHHFAIAKRAGKWDVVQWRTPSGSAGRHETLTSREQDVFHLAAEGHTNPEISQRLSIGVRTVKGHRNLMRKLGLRNQTDLVRYALQRGCCPSTHGPAGGEAVTDTNTNTTTIAGVRSPSRLGRGAGRDSPSELALSIKPRLVIVCVSTYGSWKRGRRRRAGWPRGSPQHRAAGRSSTLLSSTLWLGLMAIACRSSRARERRTGTPATGPQGLPTTPSSVRTGGYSSER